MPMKKPATTKGQPTPVFHPDDWDMLLYFKRELAGLLVTTDADNFGQLASQVGLTSSAVSAFFRTDFQNLLSRQQELAAMVGHKVEFMLRDLPYAEDEDEAMELMQKMATPCANHKWQRMFLNEQLVQARELAGLSQKDLADRLGFSREMVGETEQRHDWLVPTLLRRVRALGGSVVFRLIDCDV